MVSTCANRVRCCLCHVQLCRKTAVIHGGNVLEKICNGSGPSDISAGTEFGRTGSALDNAFHCKIVLKDVEAF